MDAAMGERRARQGAALALEKALKPPTAWHGGSVNLAGPNDVGEGQWAPATSSGLPDADGATR